MTGLLDEWIYQKPTQSPIHHSGHSQASQARALWSHAACRRTEC